MRHSELHNLTWLRCLDLDAWIDFVFFSSQEVWAVRAVGER